MTTMDARSNGEPRPVLVAYASRFGSTKAIAEEIGTVIAEAGVLVEVMDAADVHDASAFGAFVLGSAVEAGHWLPAAADFLERHRPALEARPVWLFSSGPLGDRSVHAPQPDPKEVARARSELHPRGAIVFAGAYDKATADFDGMGLAERLLVKNMMPSGDWRDWPAIRAWATEIAHELARGR
jgi:menaquinone-dependent protoporphyrinogen oxidase